jgi:hypothetical protein
MTSILQDLLDEDLTEDQSRVFVQQAFENILESALQVRVDHFPKSKTLGQAKSLLEFYDLVRQAIENYEERQGVPQELKINFTEEEPDVESETEVITFSLVEREPGGWGRGAFGEANVKNRRPIIRALGTDPADPGSRQLVTGFWYENCVRFTCWARTNKAANARAEWFENLMEEYMWWFVLQGVPRVLFKKQHADIVTVVQNNKWYGRPIDYDVKTEKLRVFREKTLEEIILKLVIQEE